MRKVIILLCLLGCMSRVQAEEVSGSEKAATSLEADACVTDTGMESSAGTDCTIRVNFTTDEGTQIQGELTFVDVSWWECTKIKIGNFLSKIF